MPPKQGNGFFGHSAPDADALLWQVGGRVTLVHDGHTAVEGEITDFDVRSGYHTITAADGTTTPLVLSYNRKGLTYTPPPAEGARRLPAVDVSAVAEMLFKASEHLRRDRVSASGTFLFRLVSLASAGDAGAAAGPSAPITYIAGRKRASPQARGLSRFDISRATAWPCPELSSCPLCPPAPAGKRKRERKPKREARAEGAEGAQAGPSAVVRAQRSSRSMCCPYLVCELSPIHTQVHSGWD